MLPYIIKLQRLGRVDELIALVAHGFYPSSVYGRFCREISEYEVTSVKIIGKAIDGIFSLVKYAIVLLFLALVALVFLQVFNRFVLRDSLTWSTELANYAMMWITLLGSAVLMRAKGHMAINNVLDALHGVPRVVVCTISVLLQCLFLAAWIYGCVVFLPTVSAQYSPVLRLNMAMVNSVFIIAGILMLLAMFDYWVVKQGQATVYSEEDELIQRMKEETMNAGNRGEE